MASNQNSILIVTIFFCFLHSLVPVLSSFVCLSLPDCEALLKFKADIQNDPSGHLQSWRESNPFCNWTGVTCHRELRSRVTALELVDMKLQGSLSPFLSNLSFLTSLSLQGNRFHGPIPGTFGKLTQLEYVNISENNLQGGIPNSIYGCRNLKFIDLTNNNLSGVIPDELGWMKNLTYLSLSENNLTGTIPAFLSNLTKLRRLELAANYFDGNIPEELGGLKKLEIIYLHLNFLEGSIPASLSNCTALREISLIMNRLTGELPSELGSKLWNLQKLYLLENMISGRIPVSLSNLTEMTLLDLSVNNLTGEVPEELGKLKKLEILYLHSNNLVSKSSLGFLTALTNCSFMKKLHLGSCLFAGSLPSSIGGLSKDLYYLNLINNLITGDVPDSIGNLSSLVNLNLFFNYLNGTVPGTLGKLRQLQRLYLGRNKLGGSIPYEIGEMTSLGYLQLSNNSISGPIPSSLGNLSQLGYLYLSHNDLSGKIPRSLTLCSSMLLLDLSFNHLEGSLPTDIGILTNLAFYFNLSNNNLDGGIPATVGRLADLQAIDLSGNRFSGIIPSSIGSCIALQYLNMSNNALEGTIPESLEQIKYLEVLDLASNGLSGSIPTSIADYEMLKSFNVSYNKLTGEVPNEGRFRNFTFSSFMGNTGLCSRYGLFGISPCQAQKQRRKTRKWLHYALAITLSCFLLLVIVVAILIRRRLLKVDDEEPEQPILMGSPSYHGIRTFTQTELEFATHGFTEANLLGSGSFGSVYKADIDDGRSIVAVKVLNKELLQSYKALKRECHILSGVKHRNLVKMIGSAWSSQFRALVLEFVDNGNLEQHLYPNVYGSDAGSCVLTLKERLGIAIDIANALEYLHESCSPQVVHCDLKPQNVLLDRELVAYVADFGIGKLMLDASISDHASTTCFLRGSIGYIPPEYAQGNEVSAKGDVYSFGIILFELITTKKPTDEMFAAGLNLRKWVAAASPNHVLDIVDESLNQEANLKGGIQAIQTLENCCLQVLGAGIACTNETPQNRPAMSSVTQRLQKLRREMMFDP